MDGNFAQVVEYQLITVLDLSAVIGDHKPSQLRIKDAQEIFIRSGNDPNGVICVGSTSIKGESRSDLKY